MISQCRVLLVYNIFVVVSEEGVAGQCTYEFRDVQPEGCSQDKYKLCFVESM